MVESKSTSDNRAYRKKLASHGLIYLGFAEHEIHLLNLSLTGLLAELKYDANLHNVKDLFEMLKVSPLVDIYLPDLRLAGEAEVARVTAIESGFQLGIEFRNLSYEIDDLIYKRRAYRKNLDSPGHIVFNGCDYTFKTENASVNGLMIRIQGYLEVEAGTVTNIDFKHLELRGQAEVVWIDRDQDSTLLGLRYLKLSREDVKGIPQFGSQHLYSVSLDEV